MRCEFLLVQDLQLIVTIITYFYLQMLTLLFHQELPKGKWFCCIECNKIHSALENLVVEGEQTLPDSLLNAIRMKHEEKGSDSGANFDIRWRVLNWKLVSSDETRQLLSKAVSIFHVSNNVFLYIYIYICDFPLPKKICEVLLLYASSRSNCYIFCCVGYNICKFLHYINALVMPHLLLAFVMHVDILTYFGLT